MPISCPQCHARIPDDVSFCPGCGRRMWLPGQDATKVKSAAPVAISPAVDVWSVNPTPDSPTNLNDRLIAALVYVTFIPAILVLMIPAFRPNRFLRFHAFQSIFFTIATVLVAIGVRILFS